MTQQKMFMCSHIEHEGEDIQGFCLNLSCQDLKSQFCLQCAVDPMKHSNCKKDLKGFGQIQKFVAKFKQHINEQTNKLNESFGQVKIKYEVYSKQLENMKNQLVQISECFSQQDYQYMKDNLHLIKGWYLYQNNKEEITEINQIGIKETYIYRKFIIKNVKKMIHALDLDKEDKQKMSSIQQENHNLLQQGIQLKCKIMKLIKYSISINYSRLKIQYPNTQNKWKNKYHLPNSFYVLLYKRKY